MIDSDSREDTFNVLPDHCVNDLPRKPCPEGTACPSNGGSESYLAEQPLAFPPFLLALIHEACRKESAIVQHLTQPRSPASKTPAHIPLITNSPVILPTLLPSRAAYVDAGDFCLTYLEQCNDPVRP